MTRTLIVGMGATGGALGARLVNAGQDVTFLVRESRAAHLAVHGLRFRAPDTALALPVTAITSLEGSEPFDLVIVALKAPALTAAIPTLAPAIGPKTLIIPLLNGMAHVEALEHAFPGQVVGGILKIVATLDDDDTVVQMTALCTLTVGSLHGKALPDHIRQTLDIPGITLHISGNVLARMWEKWAFIAAAGIITCLFRGSVGDILAAGGEPQILQAIDECERIALAAGFPVSQAGHAQSLELLTEQGSSFTSSLYRDFQHGHPVEAEHILGDLAARAEVLGCDTPLLNAAILQLRTHQQALHRTTGAAS